MPIGIDLNARRTLLLPLLALILSSASCNAVVNFDDIDFGSPNDERDAAVDASSSEGGSGGGGGGKGGSGGRDKDGSVEDMDGSTAGSDGSVPDDSGAGMDSSVQDGGDHDSGTGNQDSGTSCGLIEICDNGVDDNCDSRSDCDDEECLGQASCCSTLPENTQLQCADQKDNDCNGQTDCADTHCSGTLACCTPLGSENNATACGNGLDDDCDGKFDCGDPNCAGLGSCCGTVVQGLDPVPAGCCTPDGMSDVDQPNDGKDNECDGLTDTPVLMSAFPTQGLPTSAAEVRLTFMTEINPQATLSCSTTRPGQPQAFAACPMVGTSVAPFNAAQSSNPANNGVWATQVRWDFPDGKHSSVYTFSYYVHSSLHGVPHCTPFHSDTQWFNAAHTRLGTKDAGVFKLGIDTYLGHPFIQVKYQLPTSSLAKYKLNGETPSVDMWSLRRRFTLNQTNRYLLITRNYQATRSGTCEAGSIRVHITHWGKGIPARNRFHNYSCDAMVINRAGVGVCLDNGATSAAGPVFTSTKDSWDSWPLSDWTRANKFMWRNLMENASSVPGYFWGGRNFTSKCASPTLEANCSGIFLRDRNRFSP